MKCKQASTLLVLHLLMPAYSSNPLPPVSRLESKGPDRRCSNLRSGVANAIASTIHRFLEAHNVILPFVDSVDMQRYHDIHDLSRQGYQAMIQGAPLDDEPESLRGLKASLIQLFSARQILLCDLLALPSESSVPDYRRWSTISDEITSLSRVVGVSATVIGDLIGKEDSRNWGDQLEARSRESAESDKGQNSGTIVPVTPRTERTHAQLRHFDALSYSIRTLNARVLLMRDEANTLIQDATSSSDVSSVLAKQYDLVGGDLKSLITQWERGRNSMFLGASAIDRLSLSRSSSGLRSPNSPVHSLGGVTAVNEGSPAEALKRLMGEGLQTSSNDGGGSDEEVFEAISLPRKPKRMSMTREEKIAKMQEDRRKRATLQEGRDATTNMLRELETVIKHRPRGKTTSRTTSV
jgi:Mysoin-binding motif of peroxisomes